jgi:NAD(P)-dependent dehydrogenase (short-subunit alcohol dehydrogenase family)
MTRPSYKLDGKVALVTGAGNGIGKAIALRFGAEGAAVVVNDLDAGAAEAVAAQIVAAGGQALPHPADVADEAAVAALFDAVLARFGTLDVLVNSAALVKTEAHFLEADTAWWDRILGVNLRGSFLCGHRAAKIMAPKRSGVIINLSSGGATRAHRGNAAYDAAKGGVEALTRAMALDLGPYGVRVNALVPGSIDSKGLPSEEKRARGVNFPLQRMGEAEELAGPAVFLASEDASYITGHCLVIDGGFLAQQRSATVDIFPLSRFPKIEEE